jgi:hypothetical protein
MIQPREYLRVTTGIAYDRSEDWRAQGSCLADPGPWDYDADTASHDGARLICTTLCPVQQECADWAAKNRPHGGVWGGVIYDSDTGKPMRKQRTRKATS